MPTEMSPQEFAAKWRASALKESAAYQEHFIDLCRMLGEPTPAEADPGGSFYTFQKGVIKGGAPGEQETLFGPIPANPVKVAIRRRCRSTCAGSRAWSEEECPEIERYQWMRCKEGGQVFGNRQEIRPLDEHAFREHLLPLLATGEPRTLAEYQVRHPGVTHYTVIFRFDECRWRLRTRACGTAEELRPSVKVAQWALRVERFDSPEASAWGRKADSDNPNMKRSTL